MPPSLTAGPGAFAKLGSIARGLGLRHPLLVSDRGILAAGYVDQATRVLLDAGLAVDVFHDFSQNPTSDMVDAGRAAAASLGIDSLIGLGGMGSVYRVTRLLIGDEVAMKILHSEQVADPHVGERFRREAVTLASLRSNHVVQLIDVRVDDAGTYLVMEYVEGKSLHHLLADTGALPPDRAVAIATQVLDGLAVLHASRFVHRDVKPANILVDWSGRAVLVDLGLVFDPRRPSLTPCDTTAGTLSYMAPEQRVASGVEPRYGRVVKIEHGHGFTTVYAHNDDNLVEIGAWVLSGQRIASIGRTGRATSDHLHFEIRRDGRVYNPLYMLPRPPRVAHVTEMGEDEGHD